MKLYELQDETKWSVLGWRGGGRFGTDAHNKLQGCQMRKYPTGSWVKVAIGDRDLLFSKVKVLLNWSQELATMEQLEKCN